MYKVNWEENLVIYQKSLCSKHSYYFAGTYFCSMSIYSVSCFGGIGWTCVPAVKKCLNITLVKATGLAVNSLVNFI